MMSNKSTCNVNGLKFDKCHGGNCKSKNLIYLVECKLCNMYYVGKTTQALHKRINGHRASKSNCTLSTLTDESTLYYHCKYEHENTLNFNNLYSFTIIKYVSPLNLLVTEQSFINRFNTIRPIGLNVDNPIGLPS